MKVSKMVLLCERVSEAATTSNVLLSIWHDAKNTFAFKPSFLLFFLGSISPTFYVQLLRMQRSQQRKKQLNLTVFLTLLGSARVKDARKTLVK